MTCPKAYEHMLSVWNSKEKQPYLSSITNYLKVYTTLKVTTNNNYKQKFIAIQNMPEGH